jgi:hypothetical protein
VLFSSTEKKQMTGLGIGVGNMRRGERALLHVGWELGYGKEGSFSFPNVPPMADLIYEVELIGFDDAKEVMENTLTCLITSQLKKNLMKNRTSFFNVKR